MALVVEMLGSRYAARSASNSSGSSGTIGSALGSSFGVGEEDPNPKKLMSKSRQVWFVLIGRRRLPAMARRKGSAADRVQPSED
jgi:hypothetical protein